MKRATFLLFLLVPALLSAGRMEAFIVGVLQPQPQSSSASSPAAPTTGILRWKNGENVTGDIAAASATDVTWKSPLFDDPLELRWDVISRIDWPAAPVAPAASFGIALRDGSFLYGDLTSITGDSISIHSARHGDTVLKRSEVLSVRRSQHGSLVYSGPQGDTGWEAMTTDQNGNASRNPLPDITPPLATGPAGALLIRNWNRSAGMSLKLPDRVDVEFRLHSSKRPEFMIAFGENKQDSMRIETWDNELVLAAKNQFQPIRKIEETDREIALHFCWDRTTQKCSVYSPTGDLITEWHTPLPPFIPPPPAAPSTTSAHKTASIPPTAVTFRFAGGAPNFNLHVAGMTGTARRIRNRFATPPGDTALVVQNRGLDLSLDYLLVREWNGRPPGKTDPQKSRIELSDGRSIAGPISGGAAGSVTVQAPGQAAPASFKIADVDALIFSQTPPQPASHEATLIYNDGTLIMGTIDSVANGRASISTSFTQGALSSQLDVPRQLLIDLPASKNAAPEPPMATEDKIVIEQTTLHGKLLGADDGSLRWMPIGGTKASRPSMALAGEMTRFIPPNAPPPNDPALFYMTSGDVLPGALKSMDKSGAEFESTIMDPRKLPAAQIAAIEFASPLHVDVKGFSDPGWKIIKGTDKTVRRKDNTLEMDPGTSISFPSLMQSSQIKFKMSRPNGFSSLRLRMFCSETDTEHSAKLLLGDTGNQFVVGTDSGNGQFENQAQIMISNEPVSIRLEIGEDKVELFANDVSLQEVPINPATCSGTGLVIEPASIWGNNTFSVSLSDFSVQSAPGRTWLPEVSSDIKTQVLTVPRFEKDDPPKHLLLAANGDVLRGEVEAATDSHFGFRSGLEELNVPRDRVRAVIWLKPPASNDAAPVVDTPSVLKDRIQMRINFGGAGLNQYMSFLRSQDPNLKFKLPESNGQPERTVQMQIGGQSMAEALDAICSRFDMRYQVDADGTIVLEPQSVAITTGMARKSYWLKPDAIPSTPPVQDFLTSKGLAFPTDSSAQWDAKAGLLSMVNTPDNQTKLAALVNSDFGGSLGSPTHWLQLTSGGRIALTTDKFQSDFVTGSNPFYGTIKVPMAQVYVIRTAPPEPTAAFKALADWRLVNAPEPVIPESSGGPSPLLGKDALTFKLPLLDGGDFDLAEQKGQVVVLDFWASWCGPCIKSLPGLISTVAAFPSDKVKLIGINQGEAPAQIKQFMQARGLKFSVAMDADRDVGQKYGVDAIPHTVIVGPDGKVAWTQTGYDPDGDNSASDVVKHLLETPPAPGASAPKTQ